MLVFCQKFRLRSERKTLAIAASAAHIVAAGGRLRRKLHGRPWKWLHLESRVLPEPLLRTKMSFAQKTWPPEGRIRMTSIHETDAGAVRPLASKAALVTGANRGIGKAIAIKLAAMGAAVE